jgi:hypothetical protein
MIFSHVLYRLSYLGISSPLAVPTLMIPAEQTRSQGAAHELQSLDTAQDARPRSVG